jgi:hypothetical protein
LGTLVVLDAYVYARAKKRSEEKSGEEETAQEEAVSESKTQVDVLPRPAAPKSDMPINISRNGVKIYGVVRGVGPKEGLRGAQVIAMTLDQAANGAFAHEPDMNGSGQVSMELKPGMNEAQVRLAVQKMLQIANAALRTTRTSLPVGANNDFGFMFTIVIEMGGKAYLCHLGDGQAYRQTKSGTSEKLTEDGGASMNTQAPFPVNIVRVSEIPLEEADALTFTSRRASEPKRPDSETNAVVVVAHRPGRPEVTRTEEAPIAVTEATAPQPEVKAVPVVEAPKKESRVWNFFAKAARFLTAASVVIADISLIFAIFSGSITVGVAGAALALAAFASLLLVSADFRLAVSTLLPGSNARIRAHVLVKYGRDAKGNAIDVMALAKAALKLQGRSDAEAAQLLEGRTNWWLVYRTLEHNWLSSFIFSQRNGSSSEAGGGKIRSHPFAAVCLSNRAAAAP